MSDSISKLCDSPASLKYGRRILPEKLCDELDQHILASKAWQMLVNIIQNPTPALDFVFEGFLLQVISLAKYLIRRERMVDNLKDILFDDAAQLCEQHPQLRDIIRTSAQEKKFSHIIHLEILQICPKPASSSSSSIPGRYDLSRSFNRPYVGEAVDGFFEYLSSNNKKFRAGNHEYNGKFCSIVQSSGTGKSRLLTELRRKRVITLYMNIRDDDSGFPQRDEFSTKILTKDLKSSPTLFTTLEGVLNSLPDNEAIASWTDEMCDMSPLSTHRASFFARVQSKYSSLYHQMMTTEEVATNPDAGSRPAKKQTIDSHTGSFYGIVGGAEIQNPQLRGETFLMSAYGDFLKALSKKKWGRHDDPKVLIGIDEAHSLSQKNSAQFTPSDILCRVINAYSRSGAESIWVAFASTTSKVADFSAPQQIHNPLCVAAGLQLFPPYTYLGWDQNADAIDKVPANKVASFRHIIGFGRPLWKSLMDIDTEDPGSIFTTASQKLRGSHSLDLSLATLSQRFALDVCFGHPSAVSYVGKGVASHLRVCYVTAEDRTWSFTGYPSEPLLSCAAAYFLHQDDNLSVALEALKRKVDDGLFEIGQSGGLTSRLLLLLAKDTYVRKNLPSLKRSYIQIPDDGDEWDIELPDCRRVAVVEFLEYLFGESFWVKAGDVAKKLFGHAYVNFSHWVSMDEFISPKSGGESIPPKSGDENRCSPEEWTLRHWHRTSAVQCCHLQPLVDKMIPIFFDDPALPSDEERMSQMFVSDKAGRRSNERETGFITRTHDSIACLSPLPYIALLLDFNGKTKLDVTFSEKQPDHPETDQCLRIYASGLSGETFSFLRSHRKVAEVLQGLVSKPKEPASGARLEARVKYGRTTHASHMRWEKQVRVPSDPVHPSNLWEGGLHAYVEENEGENRYGKRT